MPLGEFLKIKTPTGALVTAVVKLVIVAGQIIVCGEVTVGLGGNGLMVICNVVGSPH